MKFNWKLIIEFSMMIKTDTLTTLIAQQKIILMNLYENYQRKYAKLLKPVRKIKLLTTSKKKIIFFNYLVITACESI